MRYYLIIFIICAAAVINSCQQDIVSAEHKKDIDSLLSSKGWVAVDTYDHSGETASNYPKLVTASENLVWVGDLYKIYSSTNGGIDWNTAFSKDNDSTVDIRLINDNIGFAAYADSSSGLYKTTDAGHTFGSLSQPDGNGRTVSLSCVGENELGYLSEGTQISSGNVNYTTDNGITWQKTKTMWQYGNSTLFMFTGNSYFIADIPTTAYDIYYFTPGVSYRNSNDGGYAYTSFSFLTTDVGWMAGLKSEIFHTTNGGVKWDYLGTLGLSPLSSRIVKIKFIDNDNGWLIVQNTDNTSDIYASNDGGNNWTKQYEYADGHLEDLYMVDKNLGYAVGKGIVLKTQNGGWQ